LKGDGDRGKGREGREGKERRGKKRGCLGPDHVWEEIDANAL